MVAEIPVEHKIALLEQHYTLSSKILKELEHNSVLKSENERKQHLEQLVNDIQFELNAIKTELSKLKKSKESASLYNVPQLPKDFVNYSNIFNELKIKLMRKTTATEMADGQRTPLLISAIDGTGKSVMATQLARDPDIEKKFLQGIFWIRLGQEPDILRLQTEIAHNFGQSNVEFVDPEAATEYLSELASKQKCLLILDDVCDVQDVSTFNIMGKEGQLLITTEEEQLVDFIKYILPRTQDFTLEPLSGERAVQYFMSRAGQEAVNVPSNVKDIVRACDYLPLALKMTASVVQTQAKPNWNRLLSLFQEVDTDEFPEQHPESLLRALSICIESLGEEPAEYYLALSVFGDYTRIPQKTIVMLWEYLYHLKEDNAYRYIQKFADRGLLSIQGSSARGDVGLHSFQKDYLSIFGEDDKLHTHLLAAYRRHCREHGWITGPNDGYFFEYVCTHLFAAGRRIELKPLLLDFDWLRNKLRASTVHALLDDYDLVQDEVLNWIKETLIQNASILLNDKEKLATILLDELWEKEDKSRDIAALLNQAREVATDWKPPFAGEI